MFYLHNLFLTTYMKFEFQSVYYRENQNILLFLFSINLEWTDETTQISLFSHRSTLGISCNQGNISLFFLSVFKTIFKIKIILQSR